MLYFISHNVLIVSPRAFRPSISKTLLGCSDATTDKPATHMQEFRLDHGVYTPWPKQNSADGIDAERYTSAAQAHCVDPNPITRPIEVRSAIF